MRHYSAALPIAYVGLRILVVLNIVYAFAILGLLTFTFINPDWMARAIAVPPGVDEPTIMAGLRWIAGLGILATPLNHVILTRLLAMVGTVRAGDPFLASNAERLQLIAWASLGLQLLSMTIGAIAEWISRQDFPLHIDAGFSVNGWLAVLLTFVLARVFAEGALMREELEGTV